PAIDHQRRPEGPDGDPEPRPLRHTFASHFLAATGDLYMLGRIMGHSHARVTQLHGHLLPDALVRVKNAVSFGYGPGTDSPAKPAKADATSVASPSNRRNLRGREPWAPSSHGGSRWFKPSIAHEFSRLHRVTGVEARIGSRRLVRRRRDLPRPRAARHLCRRRGSDVAAADPVRHSDVTPPIRPHSWHQVTWVAGRPEPRADLPKQALAQEKHARRQGKMTAGMRIDRYQIVTRLALGGVAEVWLGLVSGAAGFRKQVAVKTILPEL